MGTRFETRFGYQGTGNGQTASQSKCPLSLKDKATGARPTRVSVLSVLQSLLSLEIWLRGSPPSVYLAQAWIPSMLAKMVGFLSRLSRRKKKASLDVS